MSVDMTQVNLGRNAFVVYREKQHGTRTDGKPIPEWDQLPSVEREAWDAAAMAVLAAVGWVHLTEKTGDKADKADKAGSY
jgi:hypothetical protein